MLLVGRTWLFSNIEELRWGTSSFLQKLINPDFHEAELKMIGETTFFFLEINSLSPSTHTRLLSYRI
jgi:hypothetical protein